MELDDNIHLLSEDIITAIENHHGASNIYVTCARSPRFYPIMCLELLYFAMKARHLPLVKLLNANWARRNRNEIERRCLDYLEICDMRLAAIAESHNSLGDYQINYIKPFLLALESGDDDALRVLYQLFCNEFAARLSSALAVWGDTQASIDFVINRFANLKDILKKYLLPEACRNNVSARRFIEYINLKHSNLVTFFDAQGQSILNVAHCCDIDTVKCLLQLGVPVTKESLPIFCGLYKSIPQYICVDDLPNILKLLAAAGAKIDTNSCVKHNVHNEPVHILRNNGLFAEFCQQADKHTAINCVYHSPLYLLCGRIRTNQLPLQFNVLSSKRMEKNIISFEQAINILLNFEDRRRPSHCYVCVLKAIQCSLKYLARIYCQKLADFEFLALELKLIKRVATIILCYHENDDYDVRGHLNDLLQVVTDKFARPLINSMNNHIGAGLFYREIVEFTILLLKHGAKASCPFLANASPWKNTNSHSLATVLYNSLTLSGQFQILNALRSRGVFMDHATLTWLLHTTTSTMTLQHQAISTILISSRCKPIQAVCQKGLPPQLEEAIRVFKF